MIITSAKLKEDGFSQQQSAAWGKLFPKGAEILAISVAKWVELLKLDPNIIGSIAVKYGIRANLRYANLEYANLRGADIRHAYLGDANLRGADLEYVNFRHANLRRADLRYANLEGTGVEYGFLEFGIWTTPDTVRVGCQEVTQDEFMNIDEEAIAKMKIGGISTEEALQWWRYYGDVVKSMAKKSRDTGWPKERR